MGFDKTGKVLASGLAAAAVALVAGKWAASSHVSLTVWGDRDLFRALLVPTQIPLFGPESNGGVRSPGGAYYGLLRAILALGDNVPTASAAVVALFAVSVALVGFYFARVVSPLAGALVSAALAGSAILNDTLSVWNPGFVLVFATAATVFGHAFLASGRAPPLFAAALAVGLGMQIHMQISQVAIGLVLATAVCRPRLNWAHGAAVFLGLGLPYLPYLWLGGGRLFLSAAAAPGDAVRSYLFWEPAKLWMKARVFADLFAGGADEFAGRGPWLRAALGAGDVLALWLAAAAAVAVVFRRSEAIARPFVLIVLVTAVTALVSDLLPRHMVAATPAAAALVGLAGERTVVWLGARGPLGRGGAIFLCALVALRPLAAGVAGFAPVPFQPYSTAAQAEIAAALKPTVYAERDAFEAHAAQFAEIPGHGWRLAPNLHMSFIYETTAAPGARVNRGECMAVALKPDAGANIRDGLAASASVAGLGAAFSTAPPLESEHFLYLAYTTRDGNCLKTFSNAYVATAFEAAHLQARPPAAAKLDEGAALFTTAAPGGGEAAIGIEIRREASGYVATLHGGLLRGYTGLYFLSLVQARLCFAGDAGVFPVSFGAATVGSPQKGELAPWRSPAFRLPDGRYRIWLIGAGGWRPIAVRSLVGELTVPTLDATVAPEVAPPPSCLPPG